MTRNRPSTVVYIATSIDGFIARPDGGLDWLGSPDDAPDEEIMRLWEDLLGSGDHIVMGRKTLEQVLDFGDWPYEGTPVTVLSTTRTGVPESLVGKADINSQGPVDVLGRLEALKREKVYVDGGQVIQGFLRADLIDELILTTIPILLGAGIRLFGEHDGDLTWELVGTRTLPRGLVQAHYRRKR